MSEKVYINVSNMLQLLEKNELDLYMIEASLSLNPSLTWVKFILTDDKPNGNNQRVPQEEFDNLIKSGLYMPIKVAENGISRGHADTKPIGVITNLIKDGDKIKGIGALWGEERPEDVQYLKELYESGQTLNISWEIGCKDIIEEEGVFTIKDAYLFAATIVGIPAYMGRTPIVQMASKNEEENKLEELEKIKQERDSLLEEKASLDEKIESLSKELENLSKEIEDLRFYKQSVEEEKAREMRFAMIKEKFESQGLDFDATYFEERKDKLLSFSDEDLDFYIKDLVLFKSEASVENKIKLPPIIKSSEEMPKDLKEVAKLLKNLSKEN